MKKRSFLFLLLPLLLSGCFSKPSSSENTSLSEPIVTSQDDTSKSDDTSQTINAVKVMTLPESAERYPRASLYINNEEVPLLNVLVNDSHIFKNPEPSRIDSGYGQVYGDGLLSFTLKTNYEINNSTKIYPSIYNVIPTHNLEKREIYFTLYEPGPYVIITNDNEKEAIHLRVHPFASSAEEVVTSENRVIVFEKGNHDSSTSPYINAQNQVNLQSNDTVIIKSGAIVNARFKGVNVDNVTIKGHGIISGANFSRTNVIVPINFEHSTNINIENISIIDPAAWTLNLYFVKGALVNNVAIISSRANGDGVTLQSCEDVKVINTFVRGFDDTLVVKNYASPYGNSDRTTHGSTNNILFENCFLWVDLAQAMEIGFETVGEKITNVTFNNITVFYALHKPVISIHNANYADVSSIIFKNITVENFATGQGDAGSNNELIDFKAAYSNAFSNNPAGGPTEIGNIHDVLVENVLVKRKTTPVKFTFHGQKDGRIDFLNTISEVYDITIKSVTVEKDNIGPSYPYINKNEYTRNIAFISGTATGHTDLSIVNL